MRSCGTILPTCDSWQGYLLESLVDIPEVVNTLTSTSIDEDRPQPPKLYKLFTLYRFCTIYIAYKTKTVQTSEAIKWIKNRVGSFIVQFPRCQQAPGHEIELAPQLCPRCLPQPRCSTIIVFGFGRLNFYMNISWFLDTPKGNTDFSATSI